jgi:hypothetical protein
LTTLQLASATPRKLFSAEVPLPETVRHLVELGVDGGVDVALVAYATDA